MHPSLREMLPLICLSIHGFEINTTLTSDAGLTVKLLRQKEQECHQLCAAHAL